MTETTDPLRAMIATATDWQLRVVEQAIRRAIAVEASPASPPPDFELNAWRELGEEMGRVMSLMPKEQFDDWFPDWFGPRLFDLHVRAAKGVKEE